MRSQIGPLNLRPLRELARSLGNRDLDRDETVIRGCADATGQTDRLANSDPLPSELVSPLTVDISGFSKAGWRLRRGFLLAVVSCSLARIPSAHATPGQAHQRRPAEQGHLAAEKIAG